MRVTVKRNGKLIDKKGEAPSSELFVEVTTEYPNRIVVVYVKGVRYEIILTPSQSELLSEILAPKPPATA